MTGARWFLWWTGKGIVCDPAFGGVDPAPPAATVEGFVVMVPAGVRDPDGSGALANAMIALADVARGGPDRLGAALVDGFHGITLEAVFQPDASGAGVDP